VTGKFLFAASLSWWLSGTTSWFSKPALAGLLGASNLRRRSLLSPLTGLIGRS
jgi:hypothetical protein